MVIKKIGAYRRRAERQRWQALRRLRPEDSIAIGEALLTSEIMAFAKSIKRARTKCLAVALGISDPSHGYRR